MKKSNNIDLTLANRQSYVAILIIMYRLYRVLIRQLIPVFIYVIFKGSLTKSQWFIYFIIGIAVVGAIYSLIAFFKYYFYIKDSTLIVKKGVFKKTVLEIPFDRIQSINTEQNLIHRVFKVVKLNMDTAGSSGNELQLFALDIDLANQLSTTILKEKKESKISAEDQENLHLEKKKEVIFNLTVPQLLKVGITENHFRSGGILIFFFFYVFDSLEDVGLDIMDRTGEYVPQAQEMIQSLVVVLFILLLFGAISFIISLVRTVLRFYGLKMYRKGEGFIIESGLINKKERAAKDNKIQMVSWSQNLLQRIGGIYELLMKQASSQNAGDVKSFKVIGLDKEDVAKTQHYVFKKDYPELNDVPLQRIHKYYLIRRLLIWSYIFIPIILVIIYFSKWMFLIYAIGIYGLAILGSNLAFRKKKYGLGEEMLRVDGGIFGRRSTAMPIFKVQNVSLTETPFQRRRNLKTLVIYTASGELTIPEVPTSKATELLNYLIYKIESQKKTWM